MVENGKGNSGTIAENKKIDDVKRKSFGDRVVAEKKPSMEKNPLHMGYNYLFLTSFVNVIDIMQYVRRREFDWTIVFGATTLSLSLFIIICERFSKIKAKFHLPKICNGRLEGCIWFFSTIWWIVGVAFLTKSGGIAYEGLNIYFSAWFSLVISVYTFNRWLAEKELLSFSELTQLSSTLKWWYYLLISSVIEMVSAAHFFGIQEVGRSNQYAILAICAGTISAFFSLLAIFYHYKIIMCCKIRPGGTAEFGVSIMLVFWWIGCFFNLTTNGQVAPTVSGSCQQNPVTLGSNMYFSIWACLIISVVLITKWMKAKAVSLTTAGSDNDDSENDEEGDSELTVNP